VIAGVLLVALASFAAAFAWIFRRIVVLFAALEAVERADDNAPPLAGRRS
jgi:hypothetical protein